jgi:hypothetical protein
MGHLQREEREERKRKQTHNIEIASKWTFWEWGVSVS